ncbi:MAG: hypothetical protein U0263_35290 [Polyangiaceae bacterium]
MAYVRTRGKQLLIVQGQRDPSTKKVEQRILFTLYSRGEALEAIGKRADSDGDGAWRFRNQLEHANPDVRFDWPRIRQEVERNMDVLPDVYDYKGVRLRGGFRPALLEFTKVLLNADPQLLVSSAELIGEHRHELEFIRETIEWRLKLCDKQEQNQFNTDNPFYWRFAMQGRSIPPEAEEIAAGYWERRELDRARSVFRMLTETFHPYAEGHNYLGLIALDNEELEEAASRFQETAELGRRLFPKRIAKKNYWRLHETRPYMRGLRNLTLTYNLLGRYDEALAICDRLEQECGDTEHADAFRASIYLNTAEWELAATKARRLHRLWPQEGFIAGLALAEQGRLNEATPYLIHAILNGPREAAMIARTNRRDEPRGYWAVEDHNSGVSFLRSQARYLASQGVRAKRCLRDLLRDARLVALIKEVEEAEHRWSTSRGADRKDFDRPREVKDWAFAQRLAREMGTLPTVSEMLH